MNLVTSLCSIIIYSMHQQIFADEHHIHSGPSEHRAGFLSEDRAKKLNPETGSYSILNSEEIPDKYNFWIRGGNDVNLLCRGDQNHGVWHIQNSVISQGRTQILRDLDAPVTVTSNSGLNFTIVFSEILPICKSLYERSISGGFYNRHNIGEPNQFARTHSNVLTPVTHELSRPTTIPNISPALTNDLLSTQPTSITKSYTGLTTPSSAIPLSSISSTRSDQPVITKTVSTYPSDESAPLTEDGTPGVLTPSGYAVTEIPETIVDIPPDAPGIVNIPPLPPGKSETSEIIGTTKLSEPSEGPEPPEGINTSSIFPTIPGVFDRTSTWYPTKHTPPGRTSAETPETTGDIYIPTDKLPDSPSTSFIPLPSLQPIKQYTTEISKAGKPLDHLTHPTERRLLSTGVNTAQTTPAILEPPSSSAGPLPVCTPDIPNSIIFEHRYTEYDDQQGPDAPFSISLENCKCTCPNTRKIPRSVLKGKDFLHL